MGSQLRQEMKGKKKDLLVQKHSNGRASLRQWPPLVGMQL